MAVREKGKIKQNLTLSHCFVYFDFMLGTKKHLACQYGISAYKQETEDNIQNIGC